VSGNPLIAAVSRSCIDQARIDPKEPHEKQRLYLTPSDPAFRQILLMLNILAVLFSKVATELILCDPVPR
jgi:hypothetical protein